MRWDPQQYARYADERARPFVDLLARVGASAPRRVVDLGCGSGDLTATLADRWPAAVVEGVDSSAEMIDVAVALETPRLRFRVGDVASWTMPVDADVVVSNATLQWVPSHRALLASWASSLPADGWLALQMPGNFSSPSHTLTRSLAGAPRWSSSLAGVLRRDPVDAPSSYADLLRSAGLVADLWETTYLHVLTGTDPVLEWIRGTALRPILATLSPKEGAEFTAALAPELREAYPATEHGTPFPFRRIFAVAHRA